MIITASQVYHDWKIWVSQATGLPDSVLHIQAGLLIFLAARFVTGKKYRSFNPFLFVVFLECTNEALDAAAGAFNLKDTMYDIFYTLVWPFLISVADLRNDSKIADAGNSSITGYNEVKS